MKPRIYRTWSPRTARMVWCCNTEPEGRWGMGIPFEVRRLWQDANRWCFQMNQKAALASTHPN